MAKFILENTLCRRLGRMPGVTSLLWALEAAAVVGLLALCRLLPTDIGTRTVARLFRWIGPGLGRNTRIRRNFQLAFPNSRPEELDGMVRASWENLGMFVAELAYLRRLLSQPDRLDVRVAGRYTSGGRERPAVFVSAHLANWEVPGLVATSLGTPVTTVYTPLQNPFLDHALQRQRRALGCHLVARDNCMKPFVEALSEDRSIGLVVDQSVASGELLPFFNLEKRTTLIPARLALRFQCDLVPIRVERVGTSRYRVTFCEPVRPRNEAVADRDKARDMMSQVNGLFEQWIRERPGEWFCPKRRWPKDVFQGKNVGAAPLPT